MSFDKQLQSRSLFWSFVIGVMIANAGLLVADGRRSGWIGGNWLSPDFTEHLGGEYDSIAKSLHNGRGFSDPFDRTTGATGWVPPVIPFCLSCLYSMTGGSRQDVILIVQIIQALSLAFCLIAVLYPFSDSRWRWVHALISGVAVAINFYYLFQFTHDHVVLMIVNAIVWLQFSVLYSPPRTRSLAAGLGIFGGIAALTSPVTGFVWGVMTVFRYRTSFKTVLICGGISLGITLPWIIYNSQRLGMFCPIKSNASYELWQAQVADDDGIVDATLSKVHPFHAQNPEAKIYDQLGEAKYLKVKRQEWAESVLSDPLNTVRLVINRCGAAFVWSQPYGQHERNRSWALSAKRVWTIAITLAVLRLITVSATPMVSSALWVGLLYLMPYLLISYYERYDMAVFPLRLFLLLSAIESLAPQLDVRDKLNKT